MSRAREKKNSNLIAILIEKKLAGSEAEARKKIADRTVYVDGVISLNPRRQLSTAARIEVREAERYVSRGGYKLEAALKAFGISPQGFVCADIGSSTGGFTDVLLQAGAKKVYAVDSAYGELDWKLRSDPRVTVMEKTSVARLTGLPEEVQLVTIDISLLPLPAVLGYVRRWLPPQAHVIALLKPQYELGAKEIPQGGVVSDPERHGAILAAAEKAFFELGFFIRGKTESPILGQSGNKEFLYHLALREA